MKKFEKLREACEQHGKDWEKNLPQDLFTADELAKLRDAFKEADGQVGLAALSVILS